MKIGLRILYFAVALVFFASAILQFHHHHDDGSLCILLHSTVCEKSYEQHNDEANAGEQLSDFHHHHSDAGCSLHLSDTEITVSNSDTLIHANAVHSHCHGVMCALACLVESVVYDFDTDSQDWPDVRCIGRLLTSPTGSWSLRAPPVA